VRGRHPAVDLHRDVKRVVHDVVSVGEVERHGDVGDDVHGALRGHGPGLKRGVGVGALDELHCDRVEF
jgi:hypothetical protein